MQKLYSSHLNLLSGERRRILNFKCSTVFDFDYKAGQRIRNCMGNYFFDQSFIDGPDRVDGKAKVTGAAKFSAEHELGGLTYGVLVSSTIAKGSIKTIDSKSAERAPGVLAVISHLNTIKVPGYDVPANLPSGPVGGRGLQVFNDHFIRFYGQPVALVIADSFERAVHAASLIKVQYIKEQHLTDFDVAKETTTPVAGARYNDYVRGEKDAYKNGPIKIEVDYVIPMEVHNPMELHATIAIWKGEDKVLVYDKTQGVKSTQRSIMQTFKLPEENVQVITKFVGGGFGSAIRTWPHVIAALIGAKKIGKPVKLVLNRDQMFNMVGYRPHSLQRIGIGATPEGKLTGITHEAHSITSVYEEFSDRTVNISKSFYACPSITTRYKVYPLNLSTPTWMRGPGEATGSFALESAMDELAYALKIDPLELRLINYAETDLERNRPYSSKFLKEAYQLGAERIGWKNRNPAVGSMKEGEWLVGYGMGSGMFNASRGTAKALARLYGDGSLVVQSAVSDSGPGTATTMTQIAASAMGVSPEKTTFELGDSSLPPGPTQSGSTTTSTLGSAVHDVCVLLKKKLFELAKNNPVFHTENIHNVSPEDLVFENGSITLKTDQSKKLSYSDILKTAGLSELEVTEESKGSEALQNYTTQSYSVHFVKLLVHPSTGVVKLSRIVSVADSGKIISKKTAESQMMGGAIAGIGMALMEEAVIDQRYGKWVNNNLADYHVPVNADVPPIEIILVDKPDPVINPIGAKGMGEVSIVGFAAAVANAVYHATGKRIRELPITPDKLI